ncbi:MAG: hypothetical protein CVV21_01330 [Candidatus Goldiibacteriota bacterium HGW-Goldbacteria-1]|jgi:Cu(I)/Ag(I) efflux system membrane fusion protein|nr:MAG: hypothetical protein CVV21_01330 [Candidatus Goldiibacteriota bacterium HGW-Goldbacteria-1]
MKAGVKMKKILFLALIIGAVFYAVSCSDNGEKTLYTCPMHPQVIQDHPGSCPICGMDLVPVEKEQQQGAENHSAHEDAQMGYAAITVSPEKQQLINIKFDTVKKRVLSGLVYAPGVVAYDPELYSAASEYRNALKINSAELAETAVLKLQSLGLSAKQISEIPKSPEDGDIFSNMSVYAQVYQNDIKKIKRGADVIVTSGQNRFEGAVSGIDPVMNPDTRSFNVRIKLNKAGAVLKPEMYVDAGIMTGGEKVLSVPEEAVMNTGTMNMVFVDAGEGRLEPRHITTGAVMEGYIAVESGLKEGERVVVNGNFLIDSESRLKAAFAGMGASHVHDK